MFNFVEILNKILNLRYWLTFFIIMETIILILMIGFQIEVKWKKEIDLFHFIFMWILLFILLYELFLGNVLIYLISLFPSNYFVLNGKIFLDEDKRMFIKIKEKSNLDNLILFIQSKILIFNKKNKTSYLYEK